MTVRKEEFTVEGTRCVMYKTGGRPEVLIVQPADKNEFETLDRQVENETQLSEEAFVHLVFEVKDWNKDLSPWEAPAVFGNEGFGSGAAKTLSFMEKTLVPTLIKNKHIGPQDPLVLGGYSLAGLFALWCSYRTHVFKAIAAVSPSVWFPGWIGYAKENRTNAEHVYLSLGDKENRTKNATMATVADCIREQKRLLDADEIDNILQWNSGNHFAEPDLRCARAFSWCIRKAYQVKGKTLQRTFSCTPGSRNKEKGS